MIMHAQPLKWLLIALLVVSFIGRPWAQALAAAPGHGCGGAHAAAVDSGTAMATHDVGMAATDEAAPANYDAGKPMLASCVKSCAATPIMAHASVAWCAEVWPQAHSVAVDGAMRGHSPKPELSPPIARV
jgi:hypothetical protein